MRRELANRTDRAGPRAEFLLFTVCSKCNTILNPRDFRCRACGSAELEIQDFREIATRHRMRLRTSSRLEGLPG